MIRSKLLSTLSLFLVISCTTKEPPFPLPENATDILTNNDKKTWKLALRMNNDTRMNMGDCFLSYRATYTNKMTMHDNSGDQSDCGPTLHASWNFAKDQDGYFYIRLESQQLPELMNTAENHKLFKILQLSDDQMTLRFTHKQFSNKASIITDVYVPEHVDVENREFHW